MLKYGLMLVFYTAMTFCFGQQAVATAQNTKMQRDTTHHYIYDVGILPAGDTTPILNLKEVSIVSFKTIEEWNEYYKCRYRIEKVMPYVKIAKQLYAEIEQEKENDRTRDYRHYRKDLEKEMRSKFEKELKDLTTSQGEMLFKLLNRETGNNAYTLIKEVKGPFNAWFYQIVARRWGYDLKENYDPRKEKMIELVIRQMGSTYSN